MEQVGKHRHDRDFKERALAAFKANGESAVEIARTFGVKPKTFYGWIAKSKAVKPAHHSSNGGQGKQYSDAIRSEAIARRKAGESPSKIAADLKLTTPSVINYWVKMAGIDVPPMPTGKPLAPSASSAHGRRYSDEIRAEAIRRAKAGEDRKKIVQDLGLGDSSTIGYWLKHAGNDQAVAKIPRVEQSLLAGAEDDDSVISLAAFAPAERAAIRAYLPKLAETLADIRKRTETSLKRRAIELLST